jgi:glycosyltransferase 2 family protein
LISKSRKLFFNVVKYSATLGIAIFLLWYVYRDFSLALIIQYFSGLNYYWLTLSIVLALVSHYLRAYRWNLLLEPLGYNLKTNRTFIAVMVGYFANNLVPRLGEVTRCGILKKNDNVSMTSAFGSVVAERALDLVILAVLAVFTFFIEFDKLNNFVFERFYESFPDSNSIYILAITIVGLGFAFLAVAFFLFKLLKAKLHRNSIYIKIRIFIKELLGGFLSIRKLKKQKAFWASTFAIWFLYYAMLIVVFYAFPPTVALSLNAGLTLLIMSGLGMSAPVQGGIGVFHILVSSVLVLYGISAEDGKVFALIAHSTQFLTVMVIGGISFIISLFMKNRPSNVVSE